jgi:hypothetical protein
MAWIRNMKRLVKSGKGSYCNEFEIASECRIAGILNYKHGKIMCSFFSVEKDEKGLYHYLLRVKYPKYSGSYNKQADKKGYYFKEGELGELLALFSLYFQCRFYLVATYTGEMTNKGLRNKSENEFLYKKIPNEAIHPIIFSESGGNFSKGLAEFLDSVKKLDKKKHQGFILACYHYARALKEVGVDNEMIFIRLVSAIETLSKKFNLSKADNPLNMKTFDNLFSKCSLSEDELKQIKDILKVDGTGKIQIEKSSRKFIKFIERFSKGALRGGNWKAKHLKITREKLPKILTAIYNARSNYLHNGERMYLSDLVRGTANWDTDPSMGMTIDNRNFSASQKLPYTYWFENVVRCCLLNYLKA